MGDMVTQWLALSPHSKEVVGSIPRPGAFVCGECRFLLCLFCPGTPASSHIPKKWTLLPAQNSICMYGCHWLFVSPKNLAVCNATVSQGQLISCYLLTLHNFNCAMFDMTFMKYNNGSTPPLYLTVDFDYWNQQ